MVYYISKDVIILKEAIYTIPVNEAFDKKEGYCPFCHLYEKLQEDELGLILGASMMEPEVRIQTNKLGFCSHHFSMMFSRKNRLQLGLILESHLDTIKKQVELGGFFSKDIGAKPVENLDKLADSCYVCERIEFSLQKMFETAVVLWAREKEFRQKFNEQTYFCLPHYRMLLLAAKRELPKEKYVELIKEAEKLMMTYLSSLGEDVSWFCKKFDYRYDDQPWGNSRDAVERSLRLINGSIELK